MAADYDTWRASKTKNFRDTLRRKAKAVRQRGAQVRRADDAETVGRDLDALLRLHHARFADLGRRSSLTPAHEAALRAAAPRLLDDGHVRLWVVERDGEVVAAQLHVRAGERMIFFNGGMDPAWERESPGLVLLDAAVRDAHELGVRTFDLGPGRLPYKLRFADGEHEIARRELLTLDGRYPLVRALLLPRDAGLAVRRRASVLPEERKAALKRMLAQ